MRMRGRAGAAQGRATGHGEKSEARTPKEQPGEADDDPIVARGSLPRGRAGGGASEREARLHHLGAWGLDPSPTCC